MLSFHTILHPTDFSEPSEHALSLAAALARDHGARLVLLHVVPPPAVLGGDALVLPPPDTHDEEKRRLDRLAVPAGLPAERRLAEGDPAVEILRLAKECNADLIVLGTHGRTGLRRLLMGSVAEQIVRWSDCPVLTVKTPPPAAEVAPAVPVEALTAI